MKRKGIYKLSSRVPFFFGYSFGGSNLEEKKTKQFKYLWTLIISATVSCLWESMKIMHTPDLPFIQILSDSFTFLKFSEIHITWLKIQIFGALNVVEISIYKCYFGSQIQILFCIFRFFLNFIQMLCQIKLAGLIHTHECSNHTLSDRACVFFCIQEKVFMSTQLV